MALILSIETSSPVCSVCLSDDGKVVDFKEDRRKNSHAQVLTLLIEDLFKGNRKQYTDIDAIAVSAGPGSYTGLRIGVSVAKGLCYALNKPVIAVPTLLSLAEGIKAKAENGAYLMPAIDARRMDAYMVVYNSTFNEVLMPVMTTLNSELEEKLKPFETLYIGGDAVEKCKQIFTSTNIKYAGDIACDARLVAIVAHKKYSNGEFADLAYFEPLYLNEFVAKTKKQ